LLKLRHFLRSYSNRYPEDGIAILDLLADFM